MDPLTLPSTTKINRLLPYWAVLQTDFRQTLRSWVYRLWVLLMVVAAGGYLLYEFGARNESGIFRNGSVQLKDVFRSVALGSLALVAVLAVGSISSERTTVADAVLSRGISRYQYFLAKWHSRTTSIVCTFCLFAGIVVTVQMLLFGRTHDESDVTVRGAVIATLAIGAGLAVLVSLGVSLGALTNGTVMGITAFWLLLYGGMLVLSLLPEPYPSPGRVLERLQIILRDRYDDGLVWRYLAGAAGLSFAAATVGAVGFNRKDV
ncbi:MAG TPA: ABC transporter permease [Fimbriiglobus sp.]